MAASTFLADYAAAKARIFAGCDVAVINADDPLVRAMPRPGQAFVSFSLLSRDADYTLEHTPTPMIVRRGEPLLPLSSMRLQTAVPRHAAVLGALEQSVTAGRPLSAAMVAMPRAFPPLLTQMVRAGEATGQLGDMLTRTVANLELDAGLRNRLRSALIYPVIMLLVTTGVVVFLLLVIVPKFESMLRGKQLPLPTQILLAIGDFLGRHGASLGIALVAIVLAMVFGARTRRGRVAVDAVALYTPGVAGLYRTSVLARCTRTLGLLLQAGVPLHQALEHTAEVAGSDAYRRLWLQAQRTVVEGGSLLEAIRGRPLFGAGLEQLVAAGEATARLDSVMQKVAAQQSRDLERRIKDLLTMLEPMMVVMMAAVVGFVALSIMMPIFKMSRG
jgi:type IV pilus assembly protein PilC